VFEKILMLEVGRWKHDDGSYKYRKNLRKSVNSAGEKTFIIDNLPQLPKQGL
jgi:hypothetical protein